MEVDYPTLVHIVKANLVEFQRPIVISENTKKKDYVKHSKKRHYRRQGKTWTEKMYNEQLSCMDKLKILVWLKIREIKLYLAKNKTLYTDI